jgi:flagellar L-ring protein precursor FlgH
MRTTPTHRRIVALMLAGAALLGLAACSRIGALYEPRPQVAPRQPIAQEARVACKAGPKTDGSIWSDAAVSWFGDDKAYRAGDVVLVKVAQKNSGSKDADTDTARSSTMNANIKYMLGLEKKINRLTGYQSPAASTTGGTAGTWDPNNLVDAQTSNAFKGSGSTKRTDDLEATVSAVVTDVLPSGDLAIYGHQTVTLNHEASVLTVQGIVRPSDISRDNTVDSQRIANADIRFTGSGVLSDKQHPGWAVRALDWLWPF